MSKLSNYQKKWPDTVSIKLATNGGMSLKDVESCATSMMGPERTILEASVKRNSTIIYVSKLAHDAGEKNGSIIFG